MRVSVVALAARCALMLLPLCASAQRAAAQCADWLTGFGIPGADGGVFVLQVLDDGTGPTLYAGGRFTLVGNAFANNVARWDGSQWSPLGSGISAPPSSVSALASFDDGGGAQIYAAGDFQTAGGVPASSIARWDGSAWSALGSGLEHPASPRGYATAVFDDGTGPALYVGGEFNGAGGVAASNIARWDGSSWSALGQGCNYSVHALTVFDDGTGPALYVGGAFTNAGGIAAAGIARWNGSAWSTVGAGVSGAVRSFVAFDDGGGPALIAASSSSISKWNGSSWSALANSVGSVLSVAVFDGGSGPDLYAGGNFLSVDGIAAERIARWDGSTWSALSSGLDEGGCCTQASTLAVFDDGTGLALHVGGGFANAGGLAVRNLARWSGSTWSPGIGTGIGTDKDVLAIASYGQGADAQLYVGGYFRRAGSTYANGIAAWIGAAWSPLGQGMNPPSVEALAVFDDGSGTRLYAGGYFGEVDGASAEHVAAWNGSTWSVPGGGTSHPIEAFAVYDDGTGPGLYAGGGFYSGFPVTASISRWNGTVWTPVTDGNDGGSAFALAVYDDGTGPALYAAGLFSTMNGVPARNIARWDGSGWSPLGQGVDGTVHALTVYDDGNGPVLYVGGSFTIAGGAPAAHIARWDGTWSALSGGGIGVGNGTGVQALALYDDGDGTALYVGGRFDSAGGVPARNLARWDGAWSALGSGTAGGSSNEVVALAVHDDGEGAALYVGGSFLSAGDDVASNLAAWKGCAIGTGERLCFGDGTGAACPCGNYGLPGHGCRNSAAIRGAELVADGLASLAHDLVVLACAFEPPNVTSVLLQGDQLIAPVVFGDGLRCAGGDLKRLYVAIASPLGTLSAPSSGDPSISARSAALGDPILAGTSRVYQMYYRDPDLSFCSPPVGNSWNVSNGVRVHWLP